MRLANPLRRFTLRCLLMLATALTPTIAMAGDDHANDPCEYVVVDMNQLCGWGESGAAGVQVKGIDASGTHDSAPLPQPLIPQPPRVVEESIQVSATAIAAVACATTGVSVQQMVEPFALVGPYLSDSREAVQSFNQWWIQALEQAKELHEANNPEMVVTAVADREAVAATEAVTKVEAQVEASVAAIAALEPIDVYAGFGKSVLVSPMETPSHVETAPLAVDAIAMPVSQDSIDVTPRNLLVGGAAIVMTIEEEYPGYDVSAGDLRIWSNFPNSTQPFCVRDHSLAFDSDPMWQAFDEVVSSTAQGETEVVGLATTEIDQSAADLFNNVADQITELASSVLVSETVAPKHIGQQIAKLACRSSDLAGHAAQMIAATWPQSVQETHASISGEALLSRAGAFESDELIRSARATTQVAEIQAARSQY